MDEIEILKDIPDDTIKKEYIRRQAKKSSKNRFEIIGEWSGYNSNQRHVCCRIYTKSKEFAAKVEKLGSIEFSDRTFLDLTVRRMNYGEKKKSVMNSYENLIKRCILFGVDSVMDLK